MLPSQVDVVALSDNDASKHGAKVDGHDVVSPRELNDLAFDYVVVTARAVDPIRQGLVEAGVPAERIVAYYPSYSEKLHVMANRDIAILNDHLGLDLPPIGLATMYLDHDERADSPDDGPVDFVRNKAFHLAARQIRDRGIAGAVAELGVYRGDQARRINRLFPDRPLYLFDTFTGFSDRDLASENAGDLSSAIVGDFVDTSVDLVLGKLAQPELAKVFPGYFPETATGIEERFAFVSLDVDLYDPTRAGLSWFYERLNPGGYIFVHDYNNRRYLGVRKAVDEFVKESGACFVPLPDFAGSVIIAK
ncbi:TylF/MycF/NovP-related O-methyltransferase [Sphingobium sp.]|uniref:TylF/MycF/NovP-related O-methyltransferase n=1 Tax=Sphingobium sp. TaxID=1912891 RepID=UPI002CD32BFF|nr:TylF/MycF/NovP-related O-methyltransferase [Sphingobium sp.]HUD91768.1 TylF/MycF/NovP-related O-methyltransferase [Sphingobium sp.]